jgi:hypothetical protein
MRNPAQYYFRCHEEVTAMAEKRRRLMLSLVFVCGMIVGAVMGAVLGTTYGYRAGTNEIVNNWVTTNARNGAGVVEALRLLRSDRTADGLENLETHLNGLLIGLTPPYLEGFQLGEHALSQVQKTRESARSYRSEHPRPPSKKLLDREVAEFLGTGGQ